MTDSYLIAHKVNGSPAFDIAVQMECPECHGDECHGCAECDWIGYWWVVSTSGHRAYPWNHWALTDLEGDLGQGYWTGVSHEMPPDLPDHYPHSASPHESKISLIDRLGLNKPKPAPASTPIVRRI